MAGNYKETASRTGVAQLLSVRYILLLLTVFVVAITLSSCGVERANLKCALNGVCPTPTIPDLTPSRSAENGTVQAEQKISGMVRNTTGENSHVSDSIQVYSKRQATGNSTFTFRHTLTMQEQSAGNHTIFGATGFDVFFSYPQSSRVCSISHTIQSGSVCYLAIGRIRPFGDSYISSYQHLKIDPVSYSENSSISIPKTDSSALSNISHPTKIVLAYRLLAGAPQSIQFFNGCTASKSSYVTPGPIPNVTSSGPITSSGPNSATLSPLHPMVHSVRFGTIGLPCENFPKRLIN